MSIALTNTEKLEIQISAVLDAYLYLDRQNEEDNDLTLSSILDKISRDDLYIDSRPYYDAIKAAIESNPKIGEYRLISQSEVDAGIERTLLHAVAFQAPDNDDGTKGEIYVAYRGTGDGKWLDNGVGMYETSPMQIKAGLFFDYVVRTQNLNSNDRIIVTGHSKGGNSAQYATIGSENARLVDACYSFDGQGFSKKSIEELKNTLGSDYETQIGKMYSINGENDYVHDLGIVVIPEQRTYFVNTNATGFEEMHHLLNLIDPEYYIEEIKNDKEDDIYIYCDGDGIIDLDNTQTVVQGPMGEFAKKISSEINKHKGTVLLCYANELKLNIESSFLN